jgi:hypothetical protein
VSCWLNCPSLYAVHAEWGSILLQDCGVHVQVGMCIAGVLLFQSGLVQSVGVSCWRATDALVPTPAGLLSVQQ